MLLFPPQVLQGLDSQATPTLALEVALRGVFAGNIFDLGAAASAERYESGQGAGFHCALDQLLPRPWVSNHGWLGDFCPANSESAHSSHHD